MFSNSFSAWVGLHGWIGWIGRIDWDMPSFLPLPGPNYRYTLFEQDVKCNENDLHRPWTHQFLRAFLLVTSDRHSHSS
jgi:hypothetical protein